MQQKQEEGNQLFGIADERIQSIKNNLQRIKETVDLIDEEVIDQKQALILIQRKLNNCSTVN